MLSKINFLLRLIVAIIFLQSLFFKFSGHAEAVHIFTTLGVEPWGRIVLGCIELIIGMENNYSKIKGMRTNPNFGVPTHYTVEKKNSV